MSITLLLIALIGIQQAERPSADEIMQRVRQAMNFSLEKIPEAGLILEGKYISGRGIPGKIRMHFNRQGHYLLQKDSVLGTTLAGYDGKDAWMKDYDGESNLVKGKPRQSLLIGALYSGLWVDKSSGMAYSMAKDVSLPDQYLLQFTHEPSQLTGTISIDKKSLLPQKCKFTVIGEYVTITWKETLSYEGMNWPRNIEIAAITKTDLKSSYHWESVTAATKSDANPFRPQISPPTNMTFDTSKAALLEAKKAKSGELLVRPLVNGKDVGWFLLSTAMDDNVLHARTVKKLELETYGEEWQKWAPGGLVKTKWSRPKTISLGQMTLRDPLVYNMELQADLDDASGVPIAGIIGLGTFRSSVIELDYVTSQVALFDPKTYEQERGKKSWQKLYDSRGLGVEAEFEGHKGVFCLTVSLKAMVVIFSPAVKKLNLLEGRELEDISNRARELVAKTGKLKYFQIGGHRHEEVDAFFATSETGPFSDQDVIGMIGDELVKPFQIVFDYQNRRIAFVKRDAK